MALGAPIMQVFEPREGVVFIPLAFGLAAGLIYFIIISLR